VWTGCTGELRDSALGCSCECVPNDGGATVWVLSVWVPTASRNSACARRDKINIMQSKERARCGRQRHLQTTGSARWPALKRRRVCAAARCGTAGNTQTASSQGSVQPRLEGRVHNKVGGFSPRVPGHDGEAVVKGSTSRGTAWSRGNRVHGFLGDIFPVLQPRSLAFRRGGVEELGEEETDRGGVVLGGSSPGLTTTTAPTNSDGNKATSTQSRLDIGGAQVVRRPPQHPSGEGGELTCFRGGGGLVASRCAASEQGSSATTSDFGASATLA
jgi:hypothetical protein